MTFQVALRASNGWIMVSDTQETRYAGLASRGIREVTHTKKIAHDQPSQTAYMISGDEIARDVASEIIAAFGQFGTGRPKDHWLETEMPKMASESWRKHKAHRRLPSPRKLIMAVQNVTPFWELWIEQKSRAERIYSKVFGGDENNSAKFFVEQYYDHEHPPTVRKLLPLVAHTILMGGYRNPSGVGGLEISFLEEGAFTDWTFGASQLFRLTDRSRDVDDYLRGQLLDSDLLPRRVLSSRSF